MKNTSDPAKDPGNFCLFVVDVVLLVVVVVLLVVVVVLCVPAVGLVVVNHLRVVVVGRRVVLLVVVTEKSGLLVVVVPLCGTCSSSCICNCGGMGANKPGACICVVDSTWGRSANKIRDVVNSTFFSARFENL